MSQMRMIVSLTVLETAVKWTGGILLPTCRDKGHTKRLHSSGTHRVWRQLVICR